MASQTARTIVVIGNGMVGHRLVAELIGNGVADRAQVIVFGEERHPAYDRVHLSSYVDGASVEDLTLVSGGGYGHPNVTLRTGEPVTSIDRVTRTVTTASGVCSYDDLVLATGSSAFVPPIEGRDRAGCHVYRTLDDLDGIAAWAATARRGVVIGGGLLGLEAANAVRALGVETTVVEFAPRLMPVQLDDGGAAALRARVEALGINVLLAHATHEICGDGDTGPVRSLRFADGTFIDADLVVFSAGIRPRDQLARDCGLEVGDRGGVVVDAACRSADPAIWAVGEVACAHGRTWGLVGPGYAMARTVADRLGGGSATFDGADLSTKLKLLGIEVASFGDPHADAFADAGGPAVDAAAVPRAVRWEDPFASVYRKVVMAADGSRVLGGVLVGDASGYDTLKSWTASGTAPTVALGTIAAPQGDGIGAAHGAAALGPDATVCTCNNVTKADLCQAIGQGCSTIGSLKSATNAGTGCGSCVALCGSILNTELEAAGVEVDRSLCEHFAMPRVDLFDLVRVEQLTTFGDVMAHHGRGGIGCEVCKPAIASMLATLWNDHVLAPDHAALQDTNDRFLANIQRDGTYSVVPRVPGGEITPAKLAVIAEVAAEFDLYTKITGGQRIDLLGARLDQLPQIWGRLVAAGMESGQAYGKSVRTVKSCVGATWCRYGVQDSTALAIALEERYRGLRSPHKLKFAVSGCSRECAEAQSKDVGVIATEKGWNLYVCGNGGMRPRHATLLATDLATDELVRTIDRFLMYYVRTADRLQRTSVWLEELEGGIDRVRAVVVDDHLGIADELDGAMAAHVDTYECEWTATLADPAKLEQFRPFVNVEGADPALAHTVERGQRRPLRPEERRPLPLMVTAGTEVSS